MLEAHVMRRLTKIWSRCLYLFGWVRQWMLLGKRESLSLSLDLLLTLRLCCLRTTRWERESLGCMFCSNIYVWVDVLLFVFLARTRTYSHVHTERGELGECCALTETHTHTHTHTQQMACSWKMKMSRKPLMTVIIFFWHHSILQRAELATEQYLPLTSVLEGFVILKPNPEWRPPGEASPSKKVSFRTVLLQV